jgi:hypothetical protein
VSDLPELLSHNEYFLFDPSTPKSIKQFLSYSLNLTKDRLKKIGIINEKSSKEKFIEEIIVYECSNLFDSLLGDR